MTTSPERQGKVGRPIASNAQEKTPLPKDEEPRKSSGKKTSSSPPPEKSRDEGSEDETNLGILKVMMVWERFYF